MDEEEEEELGDRQVCHNCRYDGLKMLQEKIKDMIDTGRDRLQSKRRIEFDEDETADDDDETADSDA